MVGRPPQTAQDFLNRYRGVPGYAPLAANIRKQNYERPDGSLGDFILLRHLRDETDIPVGDLNDIGGMHIPDDFIKKGVGRLSPHVHSRILAFFRRTAEPRGLIIPEDYFERAFYSIHQIGAALRSRTPETDPSGDLEDLPSPELFSFGHGQQQVIEKLQAFATSPHRRFFALRGDIGSGKTALISEFFHHQPPQIPHRCIYIDCRKYLTFYSVIRVLHARMFGASAIEASRTAFREQIVAIRKGIEEREFFLVFDNVDTSASMADPAYYTIRDDNLADFIIELLDARGAIKILLASPEIPHALKAAVQIDYSRDSVPSPSLDVKRWLEEIKRHENGEWAELESKLAEIVNGLTGIDVPWSLLNLARVCLRYECSDAFLSQLRRKLRRRSYFGIATSLCQHMPETHLLSLRLLALAEDGLKISTLERLLDALEPRTDEERVAVIDEFRHVAAPILSIGFQDGEVGVDIHGQLKRVLVAIWESPDSRLVRPRDADDQPNLARRTGAQWRRYSRSIAQKRRAHREIARIALESAWRTERSPEHSRYALQTYQRHFQAFIHLLASLDPQTFETLGRKHVQTDLKSDECIRRVLDGAESEYDCVNAAVLIWTRGLGENRQHRLSNYFGADALKLDLLRRVFHVGFSYPNSHHPIDLLRSRLPTRMDRIGIETRALVGLNSLLVIIFEQIAVAALRAHRFEVAAAAIDRGKDLIQTRRSGAAITDERAYKTLHGVHIDLLIRQGHLHEAEMQARDAMDLYFKDKVLPRIERNQLSSSDSHSSTMKHGNRKSFDRLFFALSNYGSLQARLAEALFLQGRIHAAGRELAAAIDIYNRVQERYRLDFRRHARGRRFLSQPTLFLKGTMARNLVRITVRTHQQCMRLPDSLFTGASLEHDDFSEENIGNSRPLSWFIRSARSMVESFAKTLPTSQEQAHEEMAQLLDESIWQRYTFANALDHQRSFLISAIEHRINEAMCLSWVGNVSPWMKLELLLEHARTCILLARYSNGREHLLERAARAINRLLSTAEASGYPLLVCDANLVIAEIRAFDPGYTVLKSCDLDGAHAIERAKEIASFHDYGLRWHDIDLLGRGGDVNSLPSLNLIC